LFGLINDGLLKVGQSVVFKEVLHGCDIIFLQEILGFDLVPLEFGIDVVLQDLHPQRSLTMFLKLQVVILKLSLVYLTDLADVVIGLCPILHH
jgi:hypothetical protein